MEEGHTEIIFLLIQKSHRDIHDIDITDPVKLEKILSSRVVDNGFEIISRNSLDSDFFFFFFSICFVAQ